MATLFVLYIPLEDSNEPQPGSPRRDDSVGDLSSPGNEEGVKFGSTGAVEEAGGGDAGAGPGADFEEPGEGALIRDESLTSFKSNNTLSPLIPKSASGSLKVNEDSRSQNSGENEDGVSLRRGGGGSTSTLGEGERRPRLQRQDGTDRAGSEERQPGVDEVQFDTEYYTIKELLQNVLYELNIEKDVWRRTEDEEFCQISFVVEGSECDAVLSRLVSCGIGKIPDTSISLFPTVYHAVKSGENDAGIDSPDKETNNIDVKAGKKEEEEKSDFLKSIKSRLTVGQVVESVKSNANLTFDFVVLIILASMIAGLGLIENSSVILVASMLVSPLMGPILGWVFGSVIQNEALWKQGVRNEIIGLSLCLLCGFIFGLIPSIAVTVGESAWGSSDAWPTLEMQSRGLTRSLWVGILIALPSGAGVAFSILGGNTGSLVGVAISASLLPPAVNAGMLWAYALISAFHAPPLADQPQPTLLTVIANVTSSNMTDAPIPAVPSWSPPDCPALHNNAYQFVYSCNMPTEAVTLGFVSLFLTLLNIACIFVMGVFILKVKEVAPHTAASPANEAFWKTDLKVARHTYKTHKGRDKNTLALMAKEMAEEFAQLQRKRNSHLDHGHTVHGDNAQVMKQQWRRVVAGVEETASYQDTISRMPNAKLARNSFLRQLSMSFIDDEPGSPSSPLINSHGSPGLFRRSPYRFDAENRSRYTSGFTPIPEDTPPAGKQCVYVIPDKTHEKKRRKVRRMDSCPASVRVVRSNVGKKGRFVVTTISDEKHKKQDKQKSKISDAKDVKITIGSEAVVASNTSTSEA